MVISGLFTYVSCIEDACLDSGDLEKFRYFSLVDSLDGEDLIQEKMVYSVDSVDLITIDGTSIIKRVEGDLGRTDFVMDIEMDLTIYNNDFYLLQLNATEIDTVRLFATPDTDKCNGNFYSNINYMIYNNDTLKGEDFIIKK